MGTLKYLLLVANFLTASVYAAPPIFVVHPLLISNDIKPATLQGGAQLMFAPSGEGHVLLVAPGNHQGGKKEQVEQYDEGVEESRDWKEEDEAEIQKEQERKEDYDNGEYKKYEDYNEKSYEESSTHTIEESNDYTEKTEDETEKPEEDETNLDDGSWHGEKEGEEEHSTQDYDEKEESANESENREGKSTNGERNVENSGDGHPKENVESKRQTSEATNNQKNVEVNNHADKADAVNPDQVKSSHVPEEIVIGSVDKTQINDQHAPNTEVSEDKSDSSAVVKLSPPLKETEEVQLAPVVYHVSPKLLQIVPMQVGGA